MREVLNSQIVTLNARMFLLGRLFEFVMNILSHEYTLVVLFQMLSLFAEISAIFLCKNLYPSWNLLFENV